MTLDVYIDDSSPMFTSDVGSFTGKIVCNIDGSSYIIDAEKATLSGICDNSLSVAAISVTSQKKTSILQTTKLSIKSGANSSKSAAKLVSKNIAFAVEKESSPAEKRVNQARNPNIHTFRVVSANDANVQLRRKNNQFKIQKPILMCFICKLSFGITKSFSLHASTEHGLDLQDLEKNLLMQQEYSSAIIQKTMDENPQISFLEPVDLDASFVSTSPKIEEFSSAEAQSNKEKTGAPNIATSTVIHNIASSLSNASSLLLTTVASLSASPKPLCCANSNISTTSNITTTICDKPQATSSQLDDDQQSLSATETNVNTSITSAPNTFITSTNTSLDSLNLDKSKNTNNFNINQSITDNFSNSSTTTTIISASTSSTEITASTAVATTTLSSLSLPSLLSSSSLSLRVGVDLPTSIGNLTPDANNSGSLVNINKCINDNSNFDSKNDSITPQLQDTTTQESSDPSLISNHILPHQAANVSINVTGDFLQQHLHRVTASRTTTDDEFQHKDFEYDNMNWSHSKANTFPLAATASNTSVAQISSLHTSLAALNSEQNNSSIKLISKFLQHQLVAAQHQKYHHHKQLAPHSLNHIEPYVNAATGSTTNNPSMLNVCPEHANFKGNDCKICEMLEARQNYKPSPQVTPQLSPTHSGIAAAAAAAAAGLGLFTAASQLSVSPNHSLNPNNLPSSLHVPFNTPSVSSCGNTSSFTIGACSDHINGRPLGVECARCEIILNSARLNSNVQMSTRNSCKTLKCPQCNWHYKYQETLEIHMREKHPDGESACGYCLAGQQHPRLARGESYSCGYKPYRCEICNYSTTTKGNLSIHMQSDKHLNNMQELNSSQNMVAAAAAVAAGSVGKLDTTSKINLATTISNFTPQQQQQSQRTCSNVSNLSTISCGSSTGNLQSGGNGSNSVVACSTNKPKPSFRCDICSYETSVARNLRIHITSEKHTHNMTVLQNNIKHIQALTFLQQQQQTQQQQQSSNCIPEVALADLAYNQVLMIQLLHQNAAAAAVQVQTQQLGTNCDGKAALLLADKVSNKLQAASPAATEMPLSSSYSPNSNDLSSSDLANMETPIKPDLWPTTLFSCLVCSNFNTNNLDELNQHLMIDRSRQPTLPASSMSPSSNNISSNSVNSGSDSAYFADIMIFQNNNYICRLCSYKTNLKANYQLHSKTDKHLQKLNFINHLREGGAANEYKLKYYQQQQQQIGANIVHIKCNSCDFYTNAIQKLSLHTQHMSHETMKIIFQHLNYLVQDQQQPQTSNDDSIKNIDSNAAPLGLADDTSTSLGKPTTIAIASAATSSSSLSSTSLVAAKPASTDECNKSLLCQLCRFKANSLLEMIQHVKSIRHLQVEQFVCLQRRSEQLETLSLNDIFKLWHTAQRSNDSTVPTVTLSHASNSIDNKKTPHCFSYLIESENEDFANKITYDEIDEGENNTNIMNIVNFASTNAAITHNDNNIKTTAVVERDISVACSSGVPVIIFKCNHCDFFGQMQQEIEIHIETTHSNVDSNDFISIPTNSVAIQAFQAAMAAATLAAVSRATKSSRTPSLSASPNISEVKLDISTSQNDDEVKTQLTVKHERLDIMESGVITVGTESKINGKSRSREVTEIQSPSSQTKHEQQNTRAQCPLCQDVFTERNALEIHLMTVHSVNKDGLARLLLLVDTSLWVQNEDAKNPQPAVSDISSSSSSKIARDTSLLGNKSPLEAYELLLCQNCGCSFKHEQQLLQHAQKMQHYTMQQGEYLCLAFNSVRSPCSMHYSTLAAMFNHYNDTHMRLVISERHVYKYRCKKCSLAFKTQEKLATHTLYHTMRDATKCAKCQRNFRSIQALQKHMEQTHSEIITNNNSSECLSPRNVSPSGSEQERSFLEASQISETSDKSENESNRSITPGQDICTTTQSPALNQNESQNSPSQSAQQQQQISSPTTIISQREQTSPTSELMHRLQMQLPQFAAAETTSGMPLNPVEMINMMQFHHLISLNFMNLAPPLIFGGKAVTSESAPSSSVANCSSTTPTNIPNNKVSKVSAHAALSDLATLPSIPVSSILQSIPALPNVEVNAQILQQQQISPGVSSSQLLNNPKRARTRITDDQLKILRAHFDINNTPSEESILEMSQKASLPMKVVKHWFRNTLFKERQRNKDSPYNFNNPPSTTLNLEEYERTGLAKVTPITGQVQEHQQQLQIPSCPSYAHSVNNVSEYSIQQQEQQVEQKQQNKAESLLSYASGVISSTSPLDVQIKTEQGEDLRTTSTSTSAESTTSTTTTFLKQQQQKKLRFSNIEQEHDLMIMSDPHLSSAAVAVAATTQQQQHAATSFYSNYETKSESESSDMHSRPQTPNNNTTSNLYASMNELLSQQLENLPQNQMGPPKKFQLNTASNTCINMNSAVSERTTIHGQLIVGSNNGNSGITVSSKLFEKHSPSTQHDTNSNSSNSSTTSSGKRANRTRFTDYQIKVLQEFFENNSYPKDSDLEYLSKLLLLSPRVIVVWFQNARQKQRKIYENQPNNSFYESEEKKQNINYACKKCTLVFQRYYELIRHQKNHCFKEENNKKSAKAQIAAAQIAQNLSSEDSNSSMDINSAAATVLLGQHHQHHVGVTAATGVGKNTSSSREFSPITCNTTTPPREQSNNSSSDHPNLFCEKCKMTFIQFESLREHQLMHLVNPNLHVQPDIHTSANTAAVAAYGPFGSILQSLQQAAHLQQAAVNAPSATKKRKYSATTSNADDLLCPSGIFLTGAEYESHVKKYNFLYQYFLQNEGNSDLRQQFHNQDSTELNIEFLVNYYQQMELKKRNNYEFLLQYYVRNEQVTNVNFEIADTKPSIEFLLQYYQLCESKKFFQLEASSQRIYDGPLIQGDFITTQNNSSSNSNNSSWPVSNASNSSSPNGSGINEESNGGEVLNEIHREPSSRLTAFNNTEHKTRQNGQLSNNNNDLPASNAKENNRSSCRNTNNISKMEDQMDQLDGLQEVNSQSNSNNTAGTLPNSPHLSSEVTAGSHYQNLEDFLDATMIESRSQTLIFPIESIKLDSVRTSRPLSVSPSKPAYFSQPLQPVISNVSNTDNNSNYKKANKRLRTTILPEQLNFLYECYQNESNPSRKMLEEIAKKVSLKKRVVQVWFQNTRAKDKKSRNQQRHFLNMSDDNSDSSSVTNIQKANISLLKPMTVVTGSDASNDIIKDCSFREVNMHQHAFSVEHIRQVKELLVQTTTAAATATLLNDEGDETGLQKNYREQHGTENGDLQQIPQQKHTLALMMMAFQTQNPSSSAALNDMGENLGEFQINSERNDDSSSPKVNANYQNKTKGNPMKKKKYATKVVTSASSTSTRAFSETLSNDNLLHSERNPIINVYLGINDHNDGNNNQENIEMHAVGEIAEIKSENTNATNEENDMNKSQMYNYNHISES